MERETYKDAKRLSQLRKYMFDNRKTLSEDQFSEIMDNMAKEIFQYAYAVGWDKRNELYRQTSTQKRLRIRSDWSDYYDIHTEAVGNVHNTKALNLKQLDNLWEKLIKDWL